MSTASIYHYFLGRIRGLEAYQKGLQIGTVEFHNVIRKTHWQVVNKSKW